MNHMPVTRNDRRTYPKLGSFHIPSVSKGPIHSLLQAFAAVGLPHQPQLKAIYFASTLDGLVSPVISYVVELVCLEEVGSLGTVASLQ